jgi:hypothetical protein
VERVGCLFSRFWTRKGPRSTLRIKAITAAYQIALKRLNVADRNTAIATLVAKAVVQIAKSGERDPMRLNERVIRALQERTEFTDPQR